MRPHGAGPNDRFVRKEDLWSLLGSDWVPSILAFCGVDLPDVFAAHCGDGISSVHVRSNTGIPYTFTAHSLGAQERDGLLAAGESVNEDCDHFARHLEAERVAMNHARVVITSNDQERSLQYGHPAYDGAIDPSDDRRFAVVPPGVDQSVFCPGSVDETASRRIRAFPERDPEASRTELPAVVSSSRLDPKKNHRVLVDAFGHNRELRSHANPLFIAGAIKDPLRDDGSASPPGRPARPPRLA